MATAVESESRLDAEGQLEALRRGVCDLYVESELLARLRERRALRVKAGFDPTRPDLHLGHAVLLRKLRQFQDLGHRVVFVVGDFTAKIGDPSGRNETRPMLSDAQIAAGARSYAEQAFRLLVEEQTEVVFNTSWLGSMRFDEVVRLAGKTTLARMLERDDFRKRWQAQDAIALHELLYPLAQAQDSVVLRPDVELGGTDQLFNLMLGRQLMREQGIAPQVVLTTPILEGLDAREEDGAIVGAKMSKSLDNAVGFNDPPKEMLGKIMSIGDGLMWRYFELLSLRDEAEVDALRERCEAGAANPRDAKLELARELVGLFHSASEAREAEQSWLGQFSRRQVPDDMPKLSLTSPEKSLWLPRALVKAGLASSTSDARRRIEQGAVSVDGQRVAAVSATLAVGASYVLRAGKRRWAQVELSQGGNPEPEDPRSQ